LPPAIPSKSSQTISTQVIVGMTELLPAMEVATGEALVQPYLKRLVHNLNQTHGSRYSYKSRIDDNAASTKKLILIGNIFMRIHLFVTTRVIARLFVLLASATIGFATLAQAPTDPSPPPSAAKAAPLPPPTKPSAEPKNSEKEKPAV
jgi:hypothetical protein